MANKLSWGLAHRYEHELWSAADERGIADRFRERSDRPILPYGLGRSYGDSCLNDTGVLIDTARLDRFISFDRERGHLRAQAGVSLAQLVNLLSRQAPAQRHGAWFLPVSPGTSFVTLGGAVANDVHGKNHHGFGSFGHHVRCLRLLRSDGHALDCSPTMHPGLFRATIGGLGLTGLIVEVEIQLRRVPGFAVTCEDIRYDDLASFYALAEESSSSFEYTVAWVDCLARGRRLGRGLFSRAKHVAGPVQLAEVGRPRRAMPLTPPISPLNPWTIGAFNAVYWRQFWPRQRRVRRLPVGDILYPLDGIADWNRLYGRRGFYQYQCVLPESSAAGAVRELLDTVAASGDGSFLAVLKTMGDHQPAGLLSFPMRGTTLALDFSNRGARTLRLLDRLDAVTRQAGGRIYPAKDGRMAGAFFQSSYDALPRFVAHIDPAFSSSFWRRVGGPDVALAAARPAA